MQTLYSFYYANYFILSWQAINLRMLVINLTILNATATLSA